MSKSAATPQASPLIALLTDYGTEGWYVACMKGVIKQICRHAEIVDISHNIAAQSVPDAARALRACCRCFPPETIFVAVVDPGVGTAREPIVLRAGSQWFISPNNGLLSPIAEMDPKHQCHVLDNPAYHLPDPSSTFHGRDIFAPAAAHLASGVPRRSLARKRTDCFGLPALAAPCDRGVIMGNVVYFDHFGNALTNITRRLFAESLHQQPPPPTPTAGAHAQALVVRVADYVISEISTTYADVPHGTPLAYWGSSGMLEIGVNHGNARASMGLRLLDKVTVHRIGL